MRLLSYIREIDDLTAQLAAVEMDRAKAEVQRDDARALIASLESEREFCLRAMKAAGEKHATELAAVTKERDEANRDLAATIEENDRLHYVLLENARLRAAIAPTVSNVYVLGEEIIRQEGDMVRDGFTIESVLNAQAVLAGVKP